MALFGKKKKAEPAAESVAEQDEILVVGGDADETDAIDDNGGQVIDFDAIADELGDNNGESALGEPLNTTATPAMTSAPATTTTPATSSGDLGAVADDFDATADFSSGNAGLDADDELGFDAVFDDGTNASADANAAANADTNTNDLPVVAPTTDENPFGADATASAPPMGGIDIEPSIHTPPLTYTAPLLTSDAVATAGVPATRKSFPLPLFLGAIGLLAALGAVGYLITQNNAAETAPAPVVATIPPLRASTSGASTSGASASGASLVNLGASVDGVPIAPGAYGGRALGAPAGAMVGGAQPTVPLTPQLQKQLKDLWNKGAAAKRKEDIAGARAAWRRMLQLRPNHPGVQSAIDKLPAA